jgi:cyanate permease
MPAIALRDASSHFSSSLSSIITGVSYGFACAGLFAAGLLASLSDG